MVSSTMLSVLLLLLRQASGTDVLVLPLGVTREFVCTSPPGTDYVIIWLVNGTSAVHSEFQDYIDVGEEVHIDSGELQRNLTLTANATANNTHIQCDIYPFGGEQFTSVNMGIILQGELSPPAVDMASGQHSVMFSWSAPFTLNISDMEPDILHYVVYIIRDDGHNDTVNTTDTHYELQADPCQSHQYHVEIAAVNIVDEGGKYVSPEINLEAYAKVAEMNNTVFFIKGNPVIEIRFEVTPNCSKEMSYELELHGQYSNNILLLHNHSNDGRGHIIFTSENVKKNEMYDYSVRIEGKLSLESPRAMLSTFDVQHVDVDHHNEYVNTTCYFAQGSDAKGCKIEVKALEEYSSTSSCEFFSSRNQKNQATVIFRLAKGTYAVLARDEEYDSTVSKNPAWSSTMFLLTSAQVTECVSHHENNISSTTSYECARDSKSELASLNSVIILLSVTAAGGLLLFMVTSIVCLTVLIVIIKRKRRKAEKIIMTPNTAYEEVKLKTKKRYNMPSYGQPVLTHTIIQ